MLFNRLVPAVAALLLLVGCSRPIDFEIDNPTDAPVTLSIDAQAHVIPPHTAVPISLEPGQYRLQSEKIGTVRMVVYAGGIGGLINPTLGEYVIVTEQYVTSKTNSGGLASKVELNDVVIDGPYVKATGLFIPRRWDIGLLGELPSVVMSNSPDTSSDYRTKLYNVPGFFEYLDAEDDLRAAFGPEGYQTPEATVEFTRTVCAVPGGERCRRTEAPEEGQPEAVAGLRHDPRGIERQDPGARRRQGHGVLVAVLRAVGAASGDPAGRLM